MRCGRLLHLAAISLFGFLLAPVLHAQDLSDLTQRFVEINQAERHVAGKTATSTFNVGRVNGFFNGIVLKGFSTGEYRGGAIRFLEENGWSDWKPLVYLEADTAPYFIAGFRDDVFRNGAPFELRFETPAGVDVDVLEIGVFDNRDDADYQAAAGDIEPPSLQPEPLGRNIIAPALIPRGAWGAEPFIGTPVRLAQPSYTRMSFHHAACCAAQTREEGIAQVKAIQDFHQNVRGWSDIGYHFLLDQQGRVYQGRPFLDNRTTLEGPPVLALGAHVGGANTGNIGVSVLGCFHPPEDPTTCNDMLSPAALDSLVTLFAYLSERYGVDASNLLGHRDQGSTACPGDNNYVLLPSIRTRIRELIQTGNQPIASAMLAAEADAEGVVQLTWSFTEIIDVASYRIERSIDRDTVTVFQTTDVDVGQVLDVFLPTGGDIAYHLYAVSSTGREQRLSSVQVQINPPASFALSPNFPNPFSQSTTIRYYLEQDGIVTLRLYDAGGRLVESLTETFQEGDRWYTAQLDADGLASGSYYYRLTVEGFASIIFDKTRPLLIVR